MRALSNQANLLRDTIHLTQTITKTSMMKTTSVKSWVKRVSQFPILLTQNLIMTMTKILRISMKDRACQNRRKRVRSLVIL